MLVRMWSNWNSATLVAGEDVHSIALKNYLVLSPNEMRACTRTNHFILVSSQQKCLPIAPIFIGALLVKTKRVCTNKLWCIHTMDPTALKSK